MADALEASKGACTGGHGAAWLLFAAIGQPSQSCYANCPASQVTTPSACPCQYYPDTPEPPPRMKGPPPSAVKLPPAAVKMPPKVAKSPPVACSPPPKAAGKSPPVACSPPPKAGRPPPIVCSPPARAGTPPVATKLPPAAGKHQPLPAPITTHSAGRVATPPPKGPAPSFPYAPRPPATKATTAGECLCYCADAKAVQPVLPVHCRLGMSLLSVNQPVCGLGSAIPASSH